MQKRQDYSTANVVDSANYIVEQATSMSLESSAVHPQTPVKCIRYSDGCKAIISSYYTEYTAICEPCSTLLKKKLMTTPFPHDLCPCCHQASNGPPLSLCMECLDDIQLDGYTESGYGAWHLDRNTGEIICISLDFYLNRAPLGLN